MLICAVAFAVVSVARNWSGRANDCGLRDSGPSANETGMGVHICSITCNSSLVWLET